MPSRLSPTTRSLGRCLLGLAGGLCLLSATAHGQWASSVVDHDWRVTIGTNSYGLQQRTTYTLALGVGGTRTTTLHLGRYTTTTRLPAVPLVALVLLPTGLGAFCLLARVAHGTTPRRKEQS